MTAPHHVTMFDAEPPIPAFTAELIAALNDHVAEATTNPKPSAEGDHLWHDGAELFVRISDASLDYIRRTPPGVPMPLLYLSAVETDEQGDLLIHAYIPD